MRIGPILCWLIRTPIVYTYKPYPSSIKLRANIKMEGESDNLGEVKPKFIDIGANLTDSRYQGYYNGSLKHNPDLISVLERSKSVGMEKIIITAGCLEEVHEALDLCNTYDKECKYLFTTVGVHPTRCNEFIKNKYNKSETEYLEALDNLITQNRNRVVAIGELGLDYDRLNFCNKQTQNKYFEYQLELSRRHKLPLFLHMRQATTDTMGISFISILVLNTLDIKVLYILRRNRDKWESGVVHSFTSDLNSLETVLKEDLFIGINGCSLKTESNLQSVKHVPLNKLLLETDSPWCGIKNTHSSSQYVKTRFNTVKRPEQMTPETVFTMRTEPCHILNVAEVVHQLIDPNMDFIKFTNEYVPAWVYSLGNIRDYINCCF
ncbi:TatD-like deoxyribonuclease, putative [Theileria annulata]|uniref:TatD-like deoxyribonuclease, putative n=1 Tax=Theileria annulata TaxID=5874 RepID=Q4UF43_THEAN|nr:TatD-like deoxyribonuclease, putative [Theileria annulata]CAI74296.1 TatD-like deoxyribonuclease, putative [Theileria annulata]|eukprot:XP_952028.1 TatD-like deoxyribonuclease, putative [Theileria annulata]